MLRKTVQKFIHSSSNDFIKKKISSNKKGKLMACALISIGSNFNSSAFH